MKHDITELYKIKGDTMHTYSAEAVKFVNHAKGHKAQKGDCCSIIYKVSRGKPFRIYDKINSKEYRLGYLYGQYTWFDSAEELEQYRIEMQEQARLAKIEKAKKEIEKNLKILAEFS